MTIDTVVTDHLLSTTRAVRRRLDLDRPVERSVILDCLRLAVQAPTASNSQTWRWVVVTDPDKKAALGRIYAAARDENLKRRATTAVDAQSTRVNDSAAYLAEILGRVPVHVIPCVEGRIDNAPNAQAAPRYGSIIQAAWSFMLALRSRGVGSVWTTVHLHKEREAAALLGIPDDVTQVALIPIGYTTGGDFKPATRPPVEDVTYWDTWGSPS